MAGMLIPLGLKALKFDPALVSTVFITTFTDVCGFASWDWPRSSRATSTGHRRLGDRRLRDISPNRLSQNLQCRIEGEECPYSADAIILRTYKLGEADRIVVFLTRDRGKKVWRLAGACA